jgi:hypothetical protein
MRADRGRAQRRRVVWVVLDAAGYEITRRCLEAGVCPSLQTVRSEGYLGPSDPPAPNCETPPGLRALFAGAGPRQSGIWGYRMPDYAGRLERTVSGFEVPAAGPPALWEELERRGEGYALFNAAFRRDPAWGPGFIHGDLLFDSYRQRLPAWGFLELPPSGVARRCRRPRFRALRAGSAAEVRRGLGTLATLRRGQIAPLRLSRRDSALLYLAGRRLFVLPSSRPYLRAGGVARPAGPCFVPETIHHGNLFRFARQEGVLSVEQQMRPSEQVTAQMGELALAALAELPSRLFVLYFPLLDELSHVYLDRIEAEWPRGRGAELLRRCYGLLDGWIGRIMQTLHRGELLVVSADHGQAPFRRLLRLNALLAAAGLVHRGRRGYDLRRSVAYYHPSDCGQLLVNPSRARAAGLSRERIVERVLRCLGEARDSLACDIGHLEAEPGDPYLLFLFPRGDTGITGKGNPRDAVVAGDRRGGHHLSPLCPTPWMRATLGLWSPSGLPFERQGIPGRNTELKAFLLRYLSEG